MAKIDGKKILDNVRKVSSSTAGKVSDVAGNVAQTVKKAAENVGSTAQTTAEKIKSKVKKNEPVDEIKDEEKAEKNKKVNMDDMLKNTIDEYNYTYTEMNDNGMNLYVERERSLDLIVNVENLVNSIANHPKSFDADISEIQLYRIEFQNVCDFTKRELAAAQKSVVGAGGGVVAGAAVASVAPTAAMWIATTFGTASTGTAISSLSGAAATNAALAWLGGGALTAGGGGMAAGNAFLAMAGPIGWSIAGATLLASVVLFARKKAKTNKKRKEEIEKVKINTEAVREAAAKIEVILDETSTLRKELSVQYNKCLIAYGKSFMDVSEEQQMELGTLVNNTKSLAVSLGKNL